MWCTVTLQLETARIVLFMFDVAEHYAGILVNGAYLDEKGLWCMSDFSWLKA